MKLKLFASALIFSSQIMASNNATTNTSQFDTDYAIYQTALESGDKAAIQSAAFNAYISGKKQFGESHENTLMLGINYASSLRDNNNEKLTLLKSIVEKVHSHHPDNLILLFDATLPLSKIRFESYRRSALSALEDIADAAEEQKDYQLASVILFETMRLAASDNRTFHKARKLITRTDKLNTAYLPSTSIQRLKMDVWVAALDESKRKKHSAISRLEQVVTVFDENLDFDHPVELTAHSRLVNLYETIGEPEKATKHCIAIAKMVPWQDNIEQRPLYRVNPEYPASMARRDKEGWVRLEYIISESGTVKDIKVLEASHDGFVKSAMTAVEKWRFAPKFENGKTVQATSTVQMNYTLN